MRVSKFGKRTAVCLVIYEGACQYPGIVARNTAGGYPSSGT